MKTKFVIAFTAIFLLPSAFCLSQNTAFTYQGRVTDNGTNFTGAGQFKFALVTGTNTSRRATATAVVGLAPTLSITNYNITDGGSGYLTAPAVTIVGGGGSGATATAAIGSGIVISITVNNPGSGYTNPPIVTIAAPPPAVSYTTFWSNDGSSDIGGEPTAAVSIPVTNGLFTVVLGDTNAANMSAISHSLFLQPNLQLRIWFNDGVNGSAALDPAQNLTPAPYADYANTAGSLNGALPTAQLSGTFPVAQLSGSIDNTQLANNSITVNAGTGLSGGGTIALGDSTTLNNAGIISVTGNADITATTANGEVTLDDTATSVNTANTIVKRDGGGSFAAGALTLNDTLTLPATSATIYSGNQLLLRADASTNFFTGPGAGNLTANGIQNLGIGYNALNHLTSGFDNTASGYQALYSNTNGSGNTAGGFQALYSNANGNGNTAYGVRAIFLNASGSFNTAFGDDALLSNTNGQDNTAVGYQALYSNANGNANTVTGFQALYSNTNGSFNTANGALALFSSTNGSYNTANGFTALHASTSGSFNTANGALALAASTSGGQNTAEGYQALFANTSGSQNTACGWEALNNNVTGGFNIGIGSSAGSSLTGSYNIDIGSPGDAGDNGVIRIGTSGTHTNAFITGIYETTPPGTPVPVYVNSFGQLGIFSSSSRFKKNIQNMEAASDVLLSLRPVTFRYRPEIDPAGTPQFGLIAEEVDKVDPDLVVRDDKKQVYTVRYEAVNAMLLNEFLKQHRKIEEQGAQIEKLQQSIAALKDLVTKITLTQTQASAK